MKKIVLFGLLAVALGSPVYAQQDPHQAKKIALIKKVYAAYKPTGMPRIDDRWFSRDFNAALAHDAKAARGEIACLGYDYIVQGQDFDGAEINRTLKVTPAKNGRVKATFRNFQSPQTVYYEFVCSDKGCVIDDIIESDGSFKKNLRSCLKKNYPRVKP
ncbi:hypothetical protein L1281_001395 [Neisseria sp. HSC-16F19]|nr:DUF3828 domain-containing protein [Neisseria sp. HSC-16F19]MCP2040805.1 hypothetical protein [Neisseria sp. HSC-16F19]